MATAALRAAETAKQASAADGSPVLQSRAMIDRDQVLHVARLSRLALSDEELERMPGELSKILEHVEKMNELDLDGVEPTTHVVELQNVLREDVPRPCLPRERALAGAPDVADGGFRVPSPGGS
jgi:aspartyl-tRNA(Asn)/glutamyl-tRNA(Gln) amidotransferase subunit C